MWPSGPLNVNKYVILHLRLPVSWFECHGFFFPQLYAVCVEFSGIYFVFKVLKCEIYLKSRCRAEVLLLCRCAAAEWPRVGGSSCPVSVQPTGCSHCSGYRSGKWVFVTHFGLSLHPSPTHTSSDWHTDHGSAPDIPFPTGTDADRQGSNCLIDPKVFFGCNKFMRKFFCCWSDIFVFWLVIIESCWVLTSY